MGKQAPGARSVEERKIEPRQHETSGASPAWVAPQQEVQTVLFFTLSSVPTVSFPRFATSLRWFTGFLLSVAASGCVHLVPTKTPIPTRWYLQGQNGRAETLVVMLPGRGDGMEDFERQGFIRELRSAGVAADVVTVDAHLGYYYRRTIIDRLYADVIAPAREQGYQRIVCVGISLGGLGGLLLTREHPRAVDALVLLSPYLGDRSRLFEAIEAGGGPQRWAEGRSLRTGEVQEEIWTYLGQQVNRLPPTWLLTGDEDRLLRGQRLLGALLPQERVHISSGSHNWRTWRELWARVCRQPDVWR